MANEQDLPEKDSTFVYKCLLKIVRRKWGQSYEKGPPGENKPSSNREPSEQEKEGETKTHGDVTLRQTSCKRG